MRRITTAVEAVDARRISSSRARAPSNRWCLGRMESMEWDARRPGAYPASAAACGAPKRGGRGDATVAEARPPRAARTPRRRTGPGPARRPPHWRPWPRPPRRRSPPLRRRRAGASGGGDQGFEGEGVILAEKGASGRCLRKNVATREAPLRRGGLSGLGNPVEESGIGGSPSRGPCAASRRSQPPLAG